MNGKKTHTHTQNAPELSVVFFTLTDRVSTIPSNIRGCQSGTWSQRGTKVNGSHHGVVVVVAVDSHIQRVVLATEETTVTQQVSHRPIKCQSRLWSQRGRRSMGHIMVTTRYSDQEGSKSRQKVMRLYKQWHRPISKRFIKPPYSISRATSIDSDCCRLPTTSVLS